MDKPLEVGRDNWLDAMPDKRSFDDIIKALRAASNVLPENGRLEILTLFADSLGLDRVFIRQNIDRADLEFRAKFGRSVGSR